MDLEYETRERPPDRIAFRVDGARRLLIFPLSPRWVRMMGIIAPFAWGVMQLGFAVAFAWMLRSMTRSPGGRVNYVWSPVLIYLIGAIVVLATSMWALRSYRRYGHLSRQFYIDEVKSVFGARSEGSERWREWPLAAIKGARVSLLRNVLGRPVGGVLNVRLRRWPSSVTVRCRDRDLPEVEAFARELARLLPGRVELLHSPKAPVAPQSPDM